MEFQDAIEEIYTVCASVSRDTFPFFLICGAGVSCPEIPLASDIIKKCIKKCENRNDFEEIKKHAEEKSTDESYSFWLEKAYPSKELRRQFFSELIKNAKITSSNLQIANILSSGKLFKLVVTTNFDNQIEKSLNLLSFYDYFVSKNEMDNLSINLRSNDVQIIQIHGDYKNYTFKNTSQEILDNTNSTLFIPMSEMLGDILKDRAPIIVGYSGWENDAIMTAIKKRLQMDVPYKYYWFCYSKNEYEKMPDWLKKNDNVQFVHLEYDEEFIKKTKDAGIKLNYDLHASMVFSRLRDVFKISRPKLLEHPLLSCENLLNSLSKNELAYDLNGWLDEYKTFNKVKEKNNIIIENVKSAYNDKNYKKYLYWLKRALSNTSSLSDKEYDEICEKYMKESLIRMEMPEKLQNSLINFAWVCPKYRNTHKSLSAAITANTLYCALHKNINIDLRFKKLFSYFEKGDVYIMFAITSKMSFKSLKDFEQEDFDICNPFFTREIKLNDFFTNILIFPEYILLKTAESLKKESNECIVDFLKIINSEEYKILWDIKKIQTKLSGVLAILETVKGFYDPIYDVTREHFNIK